MFPRRRFAHLPTPLEPLPRLSAALGGPHLWVKRDDCTGLATGGNKARKLEFLIGDALARGCDTLLTTGGLQSNHARQSAAAARLSGMDCELFLEEVPGVPPADYFHNGNLLLDRVLGARIHRYPAGGALDAAMRARAAELEAVGRRPYLVPVGGSNGLGALGYAACALELLEQLDAARVGAATIVLATGSGGTQAGLVCGLALAGRDDPVIGINVSTGETAQRAKIEPLLAACAALLDQPSPPAERLDCRSGYYEPGYGIPNPATRAAIERAAHTEGLLLDPVYTGKAMAGLMDLIERRELTAGQSVVFLHTGGAAGLFAYPSLFELSSAQELCTAKRNEA